MQCVEECGRYAETYCEYEELFYCKSCSDTRHQKQVFQKHSVYPVCEKCQEAQASVECGKCGPVKLCIQCDTADHGKSKRAGHKRVTVKTIQPGPMTPPQPTRASAMPPRPIKQPRKPSPLMQLTCNVITKRVESAARKTDPSSAFPDVKSKILKIIDLARGTGNEHEADKAKIIAKRLMDMYQLTLMEIKKEGSNEKEEFEEALYKVEIVSTLSIKAPIKRLDWFDTLAWRTAAFFPDLVGVCTNERKTVYTFYGHEPSAWAAATLFAELFDTIWYYRKEYADQNGHVTTTKHDDFALGICLGLSMDVTEAVESAKTEKPLADALAVIRMRGRTMLNKMSDRMKLTTSKTIGYSTKIDYEAYTAGKKKGEEIDVNSFSKLKIEDTYC